MSDSNKMEGLGTGLATALLSVAPIPAAAQVSALPGRPDGKPSLQGIWQVLNTAAWDIQDHQARLGVPPGAAHKGPAYYTDESSFQITKG